MFWNQENCFSEKSSVTRNLFSNRVPVKNGLKILIFFSVLGSLSQKSATFTPLLLFPRLEMSELLLKCCNEPATVKRYWSHKQTTKSQEESLWACTVWSVPSLFPYDVISSGLRFHLFERLSIMWTVCKFMDLHVQVFKYKDKPCCYDCCVA